MVYLTTIISTLIPAIAFIPTAVFADRGHVKVIFPSDTVSQRTGDVSVNDPPMIGGLRDFELVVEKEGDIAEIPFAWTGYPKGQPDSKDEQWGLKCKVWAEKGFNEDIEFTLKYEVDGLAGPRDKKAHIRCENPQCYVDTCAFIPEVDSVSLLL
ncbi:uncharacterized protein L201_002749 [Kwoniella dendrophila CBS 6074]|uniref:Phosphatidylglycerol/phosphatidylinositol transfer protein n=1 Tax=Kwoniella dendrophila CBS 6074 TaxID=1295534 RepID=A0AAX4JT99_9TREE